MGARFRAPITSQASLIAVCCSRLFSSGPASFSLPALVGVEDVAAAVWLQPAGDSPVAGSVEEPVSAGPARFEVAPQDDCWAAPSNGYSAVPSVDARFAPAARWEDSARAGSAAPKADDRCVPVAEPAALDDCRSAQADSVQGDYSAGPKADDRSVPVESPVAPDECSALPDSPRAGWAGPKAGDHCAPAAERVAPHDCSVQADSVADDSPVARELAGRCAPEGLQESAVPDDYSLLAGLPVRVAPQAELRPDGCWLRVLRAGRPDGSLPALRAGCPAGSGLVLAWPVSRVAPSSPAWLLAVHSSFSALPVLAAAKAGRDVVPALAVWRQTAAEVEAALPWRLQDVP